jgi:electron transfer flavoprotein alpha subunit
MDHKGVWILAEQSDGRVQRISHELLSRGRELADKRKTELVALILGDKLDAADLAELIERGADRVLAVEAKELEHFLPEPYANCMLWVIANHRPEIIIAGATSTGRTLMPYVAIQAHTGLTADCTILDIEAETGNLLQTRPAIGGNILATIKTPNHRPQMATVRPRSTKPAPKIPGRLEELSKTEDRLLPCAEQQDRLLPCAEQQDRLLPCAEQQDRLLPCAEQQDRLLPCAARIEHVAPPAELLASRVKRTGFVKNAEEHGIQDADIVVVVGRGIKKRENLPLVQKLAASLNAALGATRDVVDRGWMSYPHQIGLSGKTVTPKLYVGVGASGSIQHLAGMQTSENIVAINIDPDAQIFRVADIGIVGNLFEIVPVLTEKLQAAKGR